MCGTDVFKMYLKYLFKILNLDTHKKSKTEMRKMELKLELNFVIIHIEKKKMSNLGDHILTKSISYSNFTIFVEV